MTIQTIQLNKLALFYLNARKVKPKEIEALAADIQARGVLQNLIGYDEDGKIRICAGGRRYRALKLLQKAKAIPGTFEVPVEIRSKDEALEISLAENAQREDMHPPMPSQPIGRSSTAARTLTMLQHRSASPRPMSAAC
jgi:ParB family chromosome partitioning protein